MKLVIKSNKSTAEKDQRLGLVIFPGSEGLEKAKYTSKKKGKDGKWIYTYGTPKGKQSSKKLEISGKRTGSKLDAAKKKYETASANLAIHRSGNNYDRFMQLAPTLTAKVKTEASYKKLMGLKTKFMAAMGTLPKVEQAAYMAAFDLAETNYKENYSPKSKLNVKKGNMNAFDWGKTTEERNRNIDAYEASQKLKAKK